MGDVLLSSFLDNIGCNAIPSAFNVGQGEGGIGFSGEDGSVIEVCNSRYKAFAFDGGFYGVNE